MAAVIILLAALMAPALASSSSDCIDANLPGILDLGKCVGTSLELCSSKQEDVLSAVGNITKCLVDALVAIDPGAAVSALTDIIILVLGAVNLPVSGLPKLIGGPLLFGDKSCSEPISVTLPGVLNLGKCLNSTLLTCEDGEPATDQLLGNLISTLACLLEELLTKVQNAGDFLKELACSLVSLLKAAADRNIMVNQMLVEVFQAASRILQSDAALTGHVLVSSLRRHPPSQFPLGLRFRDERRPRPAGRECSALLYSGRWLASSGFREPVTWPICDWDAEACC